MQDLVSASESVTIPDAMTTDNVCDTAMFWLLAMVRRHAAVCAAIRGEQDMLTLAFMTDMATTHMQLTRHNAIGDNVCNKGQHINMVLLGMLDNASYIHDHLLGSDHPCSIQTASLLVDCMMSLGMNSQSEVALRELYAVTANVLGADHPITLANVNQLCNSLISQGKYTAALEMYDSAMRELCHEHPWIKDPINHPYRGGFVCTMLASMTMELAACLSDTGNHVEAEAVLLGLQKTESLLVREPRGHAVNIKVAATLATTLLSQERHGDAMFMCAKIMTMQEVKHVNVSMIIAALADKLVEHGEDFAAEEMYLHVGKYGSPKHAENMYHNVMHIRMRMVGEDDESYVSATTDLAGCLARSRKYDEALAIYTTALEYYKDQKEFKDVIVITQCMAGCHMQQGTWADAKRLYAKAMGLSRKHPDAAESWTSAIGMCKCLEHEKKYAEAETLYRDVLDIAIPKVGPHSRDCISSRIGIAACMLAQGKVAEAEQECEAVMRLSHMVLGKGNMHTTKAEALLQRCRVAMANTYPAKKEKEVRLV
jgi:tetratricopeptide (TPR) repeat protein